MTTVYRIPNSRPSTGDGGWKWGKTAHKPTAYHTDPTCRYIAGKDVRETTKAKAEQRGLTPCKACATDGDTHGTIAPTECPLCGEDISQQLASHIRHECTGK